MSFKEIIESFKTIEYSKYKDITSYEKLMLYAASQLEKKGVPLTFNYLCVASYNLFTDVFCLDNEFKNHMSPDRLNRTFMHLKYVKNHMPYIEGTQENGFHITKYGKAMADEVENIIRNGKVDKSISKPVIDLHKKGSLQDYTKFKKSEIYLKFEKENLIDMDLLWKHFNVIPYTLLKKIKTTLDQIADYSNNVNDEKCFECIKLIKERM